MTSLLGAINGSFTLIFSQDIYRIPVLFDSVFDESGIPRALAITPNLVNSAVYIGALITPDPFLHSFSEEDVNMNWHLDANEDTNLNFMLDTLRDPFQAWFSANLPSGITVQYIDDWLIYHLNDGEVHCSSNERRQIPISGPFWWDAMP